MRENVKLVSLLLILVLLVAACAPTPEVVEKVVKETVVVEKEVEVEVTKVVEVVKEVVVTPTREARPTSAPPVLVYGGGPFEDPRVQEAVLFAVPWVDLTEQIFPDQDVPVAVELWEEGLMLDDAREMPYDPDRAWELLAEAGFPDGFVLLLLLTPDDEPLADMTRLIAEELQNINISVEFIEALADDTHYVVAEIIANGDPALWLRAPGVSTCTTEIAPPSGTEPEELVRLVADATGDFVLDHPLFTEVYDVVFEDNSYIPPALDIVQVEVRTENGIHTIQIRTQEGGVIQEMSRDDQRVSFGVYIDSDGNGVSDFLLTTTDNPERGVIVTPEFELVEEMSELAIGDTTVTMQVPEEIVGARFHWIAFSGYSPRADAFHPTAMEGVFVVPDVDVVSSVPDMAALIAFYSGPGTCQVVDKLYVACCGGACPGSASVPLTTIPGTSPSQQGKLFYRKRCGTRIYEFWCRGACFGSRVYGGGTTGWVGRCPYLCGMNFVNVWVQIKNAPLDKVYHTVRDADCSAPKDPKKHRDSDGDHKMDSMAHTYLYATDQLENCNLERDENTGAQLPLSPRCCPNRKPYANHSDVPGSIDGSLPSYNCPISAP
jgi:hypothetical protein